LWHLALSFIAVLSWTNNKNSSSTSFSASLSFCFSQVYGCYLSFLTIFITLISFFKEYDLGLVFSLQNLYKTTYVLQRTLGWTVHLTTTTTTTTDIVLSSILDLASSLYLETRTQTQAITGIL
jgi:hypothetical protein